MAIVCDVRIVTILERGYRVFLSPLPQEDWPIRTAVTEIHIERLIQ